MKVEGNDRAFAAWEDLRRRVEALESRLPVPMADKQHCGAMHRTGNWHCNREPQHPDAHQCWHDGGLLHEWDDDPEPVPVVEPCACKEGTLARGQLEKVTDSRYTRTTHYRECCNRVSPIPKPDPAPVPEWRALVNEVKLPRDLHPLAAVLYDLHCLDVFPRAKKSLARIIAVAEAQVGDGWQVEPDAVRFTSDSDVTFNVGFLIDAMGYTQRWRLLGNRAAAWLRDLLKEQS